MKSYSVTKTEPHFGVPGARRTFFQRTQKTDVYDAIHAAGVNGLTRQQIADKIGLPKDRISFYLSDLRRAGYIEVKGDPTTVSVNMNADEAAFAAMLGLENALITRARELGLAGVTDEMNKGFVRYQKMKEMVLTAPSSGSTAAQIAATRTEQRVAMRMTLIELVKLVFGVLVCLAPSTIS